MTTKTNRMFNMRFLLLFLAGIFFKNTLLAQPALPKSKAQLAAEELVFRTTADYLGTRTIQLHRLALDPCSIQYPCPRVALPVRLISFTGVRTDDANVTLVWETTEEVNNDYFLVERTLNPASGFETVGQVKGKGSSSLTTKYQMVDANHHSGYTYYRLKQIDVDDTFAYSSVVGIKGSGVSFSVTAFPNPGQSKNLGFEINGLKEDELLSVAVYDARGVLVYKHDNYLFSPEIKVVQFGMGNLPVGKYSIKIKRNQGYVTTSFAITH